MNNAILVSENVRLTFSLTATKIYVSSDGEVYLSLQSYNPKIKIPPLTVEYLESLCSKFYYGGYEHPTAIADIMLLNGFLSTRDYGDFYYLLRHNMLEQRLTIISAELCQ